MAHGCAALDDNGMHINLAVLGRLAYLLVPLCVAACGGGGNDLRVDFDYGSPANVFLFKAGRLPIRATGLEGETPKCSVSAGALPPGMTIQRTGCAVEGTPTTAGRWFATISLTVSGYDGRVEKEMAFTVVGPAMTYDSLTYYAGVPFNPLAPYDLSVTRGDPLWQPSPGDVVTYSIVSGSLPAGLTLEPTTGVISGFPAEAGAGTFRLQTIVVSGGRTETRVVPDQSIGIRNGLLAFYGPNNTPVYSRVGETVTLGLLVSPPPVRPSDAYQFLNFRFSTSNPSLPQGITLDENTGLLSVTPQMSDSYRIRVLCDLTIDGQTYTYELQPLDLVVSF
jgi:Putative Ig domain